MHGQLFCMAAPEFHEHGYNISLQEYKKLEFRAEETVKQYISLNLETLPCLTINIFGLYGVLH